MEKGSCGQLWNNFVWEDVFVLRTAVQQHALGSVDVASTPLHWVFFPGMLWPCTLSQDFLPALSLMFIFLLNFSLILLPQVKLLDVREILISKVVPTHPGTLSSGRY